MLGSVTCITLYYNYDVIICSDHSVKELLRLQKLKVLPVDKNEYQRIVIRRKHLWEDALRYFRGGINFKKYIRVTFISEPAVDEGGPMRDFLHIMMGAIAGQNALFSGEEYRRVPSPNLLALEKETYKYIGQMLATSLIFGGPAPDFFATPIVQYFVHGLTKVRAAVDDVPDADVRAKLKQVYIWSCSVFSECFKQRIMLNSARHFHNYYISSV